RLVLPPVDGPHEVRPVEPPHHHHRVPQPQLLDDVAADGRRGGGGDGENGRGPAPGACEEGPDGRDAAVGRAEVVAPLRDAVGLVDGEEGDVQAGRPRPEQLRLQPLGRHVEEAVAAELGVGEALVEGARAEGGRERDGGDAARGERLHLVLHQRHERRDDEDEAVEQHGRELVQQRLPATRREHGEHVAPGEDGLDGLALPRAEGVVAPVPPQGGQRPSRLGAGRGIGGRERGAHEGKIGPGEGGRGGPKKKLAGGVRSRRSPVSIGASSPEGGHRLPPQGDEISTEPAGTSPRWWWESRRGLDSWWGLTGRAGAFFMSARPRPITAVPPAATPDRTAPPEPGGAAVVWLAPFPFPTLVPHAAAPARGSYPPPHPRPG